MAAPGRLARFDWVDSHHHFWQLARFPYRWLAPSAPPARFGDKAAISRDYLPPDYLRDMAPVPLTASVHVQANCGAADPANETRWLQKLSDNAGWPTAAIAEVDLTAPDAIDLIDRHRTCTILRGVRTPVAWDDAGRWRMAAQPGVLRLKPFHDNARYLAAQGLSLDIVVVPAQLPEVAAFAQAHPDLTLVINHFATLEPHQPGNADQWRSGITALADVSNVVVKLSGLWTADKGWAPRVLTPFVTHLLDSLGAGRVMWGSNLPVESVNCPLTRQYQQLETCLAARSDPEIAQVLGATARRVYRL